MTIELQEKQSSTFDANIQRGVNAKILSINEDNTKITYHVKNEKTYKFSDPEELVRASYFVELILDYDYPKEKIALEVVVPRRTPSDLADIVIYEDNKLLKPYIIIECKKDGITDNEFNQAIEQSFGNVNSLRGIYCGVIAGNTRRFYDAKNFPQNERTKNIIADIPISFGVVQEYRYKKNDPDWDIKAISKGELIRILKKCNDTLWDGGRMAPTEAFDELCKIIFIKVRDEQTPRKSGDPYDFQIKTYESAESVYSKITGIYQKAKELDPDVFTENITSSPAKVFTVVNHLQGINLSKTDLDTKGVAFEQFMEDFFKGKQGQYFTPREIVDFIVKVCNINHTLKVLDPACGSGGFLLHALDSIRNQATEFYAPNTADHYKFWHDFAANNLFGIEVNDKIARVSKMNMIIHDDGHTNVIGEDALEDFAKIQEINQKFEKEKFDLIVTNPPFGATIKKEEKPYIGNYQLGKSNDNKPKKTQKSEVLFIERCWEFLKPESGRLAIILPDGILTNTTLKYVRQFIIDKFQIEAIFSLPQVTFLHYGAGLKSSILLLRKKADNEKTQDYNIFLSIINKVGYDATGRKDKSELSEVIQKFYEYKSGKHFYEYNNFVKKLSELNKNRLDAYYYSPMFEDILKDISKCPFPLMELGDVCEQNCIFNGSTPAKDDYSENPADPKIVKVASLKKGKVGFDFVEYVNPDIISTKVIKNGDILILSSAHQAEYLGKNPCIVEIPEELQEEAITFVGELINIRVNQLILNPYYLLQLLNTRNYYLLINREKRGQTSHLYPSDFKKIKIPVPDDINLQNKNAENYKTQYAKYEEYVKKANQIIEDCINQFDETFLKS